MKSWNLDLKLVPSPSMRAYLANWSTVTRIHAHSPERAISLGLRKLRPQLDRNVRRAMKTGGIKVTVTYLGDVEMAKMTEAEIRTNQKRTGNVVTRKCDQCQKPIERSAVRSLKGRKEEFCSDECTDQFVSENDLKQFQRKGQETTMPTKKDAAKKPGKTANKKMNDFVEEQEPVELEAEDADDNEDEVDDDADVEAADDIDDDTSGDEDAEEEEEPVTKAPKKTAPKKTDVAKVAPAAKAPKAPAAKEKPVSTEELTPRQALAAIPKDVRYKGKFPVSHVLGMYAAKFGAKKVEGEKGHVQLPLDKPRKVTVADLAAVCPADLNAGNYIKVLGDYGTEGGHWHVVNDGTTVTLNPGKKK